MANDTETELTLSQSRDLRALAAIMIPPSDEYGVPGADDESIFADIVRSLGRDREAVCAALARLASLSGGAFSDLAPERKEAVAEAFLSSAAPELPALGRAVLQCYYRDDRVMRSLGLEARPPFPKGHVLEQGDWSLLDPVRARPKLWRDA